MTIQQFGNAFKEVINRDGSEAQKKIINSGAVVNFYAPATNYAATNSTIIDAFFNDAGGNVSRLTTNDLRNNVVNIGDANYTITAADLNGLNAGVAATIFQVTNLLEDWRAPVAAAAD